MKKEVKRNPDKPFEDEDGNWKGIYRHRKNETLKDKRARELASRIAKEEKIMEKTAESVDYGKLEKEFEDKDGNWIGIGRPNTKKYRDSKNLTAYFPHRARQIFKLTDIEVGELEKLEHNCRGGDEKACIELNKLKKDNEDFLEHLMAIANHDEYPPKLKEPDSAIQKKHLRGCDMVFYGW